MAHLSFGTASYFGAQTALGSRDSRKVGHNTYLHTGYGGAYAVRYHSTDILTMLPDGTLRVSTGGWWTNTTLTRINGLLPAPFRIGSHRVGKVSTAYLWVRGYPVTPFVDGLVIDPAAETVSYDGAVILTADDIAAIITAAQDRRALLDARRETRRAADHAARPDGSSDTFRHRWDCDACRTLRTAEDAARRATLAAEHGRGEHVATRPVYAFNRNADGSTDYGSGSWHDTGEVETYSTCPWQCPDR